ncbi:MAG TPA: DUF2442 domain-containing protein, partial [Saprospiraceae bacterium]|nr:DUF2442 domain-containing protein [Saprospiraceae bacterium]
TLAEKIPKAVDLWFTGEMLYVRLEDGREVGTPLNWFPKLKSASEIQRSHWRFIGQGIGIHWEDIDEDISVRKLIFG